MLYPLSSHIIQHFHAFLISYANMFTSYTPLTVAKQPPFVASRRGPDLRDLLVKAPAQLTVISNNHFPPGSFRCRQNCATCPYMTNGLSYTFYATGETRSITSHITCNTKNVIYIVQCNRCNVQYIGETKRRLKDRFNEHRRAVDKNKIKSKPTTVSEHFLSLSLTILILTCRVEKIHSSRDSVRNGRPLGRKSHLIHKAMTLETIYGLNHRDELYYCNPYPYYFLFSSFFLFYVISASPF